MKWIRNWFLSAEHWQIVLWLVVLPTLVEIALASQMSSRRIWTWHDFGWATVASFVTMAVYMLLFVGWLGSMAYFFRSKTKPELQMNDRFFQFSLMYPPLYTLIFAPLLFTDVLESKQFIIPLHIVCMICIFYLLYFTAKSLVLMEKGEEATFYDSAGPFFLIWFFPIGIWVIQPRVNRLFASESGEE
jgi:hypothetical protein